MAGRRPYAVPVAAGIELKRVQKGRGKVHLTPAVRPGAPTRTLCGQEFGEGMAGEVEADPTCSICLRRRSDPAAVSSAFFMEDAGEQLLELSLAQARERAPRPAVADKPAPPLRRRQEPRPEPARPPAPAARKAGELEAGGLREFSDDVFLSPEGVIVRVERGRIAEVVGEGRYQVVRRGDRLTFRAGGVVIEATVSEVSGRAG